jgi:hypothetical protein
MDTQNEDTGVVIRDSPVETTTPVASHRPRWALHRVWAASAV